MKKNFKDAVQMKINWKYDKKSSKMWEILSGLKAGKLIVMKINYNRISKYFCMKVTL